MEVIERGLYSAVDETGSSMMTMMIQFGDTQFTFSTSDNKNRTNLISDKK